MASLIDGKAVAKSLRDKLKERIETIQRDYPKFRPGLAILQVGDRPDSNVYIKHKVKAATEVGVNVRVIKLPKSVKYDSLVEHLKALNCDPFVHGIIVQLPLDIDEPVDTEAIINTIDSTKDIDGLTILNAGRLARGELENTIIPCTPNGCLELLKSIGVDLAGKHCVVVGRSRIVGGPASALFLWNNATVTTCHSRTKNLDEICRTADVLLVAVGQPNLIKGSWLKPGVVVIDCGMNTINESNSKKLCGDVDFEEARLIASFITPNTVDAAVRQQNFRKAWPLVIQEVQYRHPVPSDIAISKAQVPIPVTDIGLAIGLAPTEIEPFGKYKAKISLNVLERLTDAKNGNYVVVTSMTPTPEGIGKSTITIGLVQALNASLSVNAIGCVRQPSLGPTFSMKGGAAGGGYSQIIPMEEFNLHLTGDIHAVVAAANLIGAAIDARIFHEATLSDEGLYKRLVPTRNGTKTFSSIQTSRLCKLGIQKDRPEELTENEIHRFVRLDIDPSSISWNRVIDTNDRFLRTVTIGQSPSEKGMSRECHFSIAAASELMVILSMATSLRDMRSRLGKIVVAFDKNGSPVTTDDLGVTGGVAVLLKDAIRPTLMQTLGGCPVFVHTGPFANIAHGSSSMLADLIALKLVGPEGVVVTEAGFGADIGFEKFANIKCRASGLAPNAVVLVVTVGALKRQAGPVGRHEGGGDALVEAGCQQDLSLIERGCDNMIHHIKSILKFGVAVVVAINRFNTDLDTQIALIKSKAIAGGAFSAVVCDNWAYGAEGAAELAVMVKQACNESAGHFRFLYADEEPIMAKIERIAKEIYGAEAVEFLPEALKALELFKRHNIDNLPVCMAKTPLSLSMDPKLVGVPSGYVLPVRDVKAYTGAGFVYALVGDIQTMPGLPLLGQIEGARPTGLVHLQFLEVRTGYRFQLSCVSFRQPGIACELLGRIKIVAQ
uniref:C-1-tetrahydrofolate synthase, cytoplasmic n=1 Tax=Trichuris muris TaxID=70415 RepID=A0A5S6QRP1_TRIMR